MRGRWGRSPPKRATKIFLNVSENKSSGRKLIFIFWYSRKRFWHYTDCLIPQFLGVFVPDRRWRLCPLHTRWVNNPRSPIRPTSTNSWIRLWDDLSSAVVTDAVLPVLFAFLNAQSTRTQITKRGADRGSVVVFRYCSRRHWSRAAFKSELSEAATIWIHMNYCRPYMHTLS